MNDFNERYLLDLITCAWQNHPDFSSNSQKAPNFTIKMVQFGRNPIVQFDEDFFGLAEAGPSKLDVSPSNIYLHMWSIFTVLPGRRQLFDPKLIVSDEDALKAWERDPLVSRGKLLWSQGTLLCWFEGGWRSSARSTRYLCVSKHEKWIRCSMIQ